MGQCVRDWDVGSEAGFLFYVSFSLVLDVMAILCLIGCSVVVHVSFSTHFIAEVEHNCIGAKSFFDISISSVLILN